ncbi:p450-domain-containing protein [Lentinus tigrinus ALCF2SS1-7]|uniref:p450-domain-containing protein n=1 Tax=Lentinus tigrinus ALCF2SS1-7 TaxID=1328758 RepID=UPI001165D877|nr:p450-domain-containing protein [Lentinus tigrinus ALCF2SS1-7]
MVLHPDVQQRAQAELDTIIGPDRLPDHGDRADLPYINALVKEVLRWAPVAPLSVPHVATEDIEYSGYFIPARTVLIPNTWPVYTTRRRTQIQNASYPTVSSRMANWIPMPLTPLASPLGMGEGSALEDISQIIPCSSTLRWFYMHSMSPRHSTRTGSPCTSS